MRMKSRRVSPFWGHSRHVLRMSLPCWYVAIASLLLSRVIQSPENVYALRMLLSAGADAL